MPTRVIQIPADLDIASAAAEGASVLRAGGLVGFPTETVYGVGAMATNAEALERLRDLKDRPRRPFGVHMGDPRQVRRYVRRLPQPAANLIAKGWPGPVTILLRTGGSLADKRLEEFGLHAVLCQEGVIGLRCPDAPVAREMLLAAGDPVVASSANLAGRPSPRSAQDVLEQLGGRIDLLLDAGPTRYGTDSTIVDFSAEGWRIVRQGLLDARAIRNLTTWRILFVCTGNTCRSPMAEGLARVAIARRLGCQPESLADHGVEVLSAGLLAIAGGRASPEAVRAAAALGADISRHKTRKLTPDLVQGADVVLCMTDGHAREVRAVAPSSAGKVRRLDEETEVEDPVGLGPEEYDLAARHIQRAIVQALEQSPAALPDAGGRS